MSCCKSEANPEQIERSKQIDRILKEDKQELQRQYRLLLLGTDFLMVAFLLFLTSILGTGDSGKSTFLKQMKVCVHIMDVITY